MSKAFKIIFLSSLCLSFVFFLLGFFGRSPQAQASFGPCSSPYIDLRVTVSCGNLGQYVGQYGAGPLQGSIQCVADIKNYGCDLTTNIGYNEAQGLGGIFYYNLANAQGDVIGQGVTIDDVLTDSGGWEIGGRCESNVVGNSVNSGTGQKSSCDSTGLRDEEYFITFCARGKTGPAGGEAPGNLSNNCATLRVTANKPDLVVEEVSCLGCTRAGEDYFVAPDASFTLQAVVKNQGQADSGSITASGRGVTFSVGSSGVPNVAFGLGELNPEATANKDPDGNSFQYTFNFPASFLAEKWQDYKICVDPLGALGGGAYGERYGDILESGGTAYSNDNELSNCKIFRASALLPNLIVHTFDAPSSVPVGTMQNLKVKVENKGAVASGATTVRVYKTSPDPQEQVCGDILPALGAAGSGTAVSETFSCPFTFSQKNTYNFQVRIDEAGLVEEINDDDNIFPLRVTADYPDFTVPELTCYPDTPSSPGTAGAPITNENFFCGAKIQNTGRAPILENLDEGITFYSVDSSTETPINHCTATLKANDVKPNEPGQQVQCAFSSSPVTPALAMQQIKVCVDHSSPDRPEGYVSEHTPVGVLADDDVSNCKTQDLNFQLPDLEPRVFTCKYSIDGTTWTNCMQGISGATDWRVPDYVDVKFAAKAKNTGDVAMPRAVTKGMVYSFNGQEKCEYNLGVLEKDNSSDFIPGGSNASEWCSVNNMNHIEHPGEHIIKACADPKASTAFGELFEKDDTDESNCVEKSIAIASPNLTATLNCPATVSRATPFNCTATINNATDIAMAAINSPQGIVFYLDGTEVDGQTVGTNNCRFGLSALGAYGGYSQTCQFTFSDNLPHTIKVCVDPKDKQPPYGEQFEEDDSNASNCAESTVLMVVPDFMLDPYYFNCPSTIVTGQGFVCEVEVRNNNAGADYTLPVPIAFYIDNNEVNRIDHMFTPIRKEIESGVMRVNASDVPASGVVSIKVHLDPDNEVYESNAQGHDDAENNNIRVIEGIPVVESLKPNLMVIENSIMCYDDDLLVQTGEMFACEAKVKNAGNIAPSGGFYSLFYSGWESNSFLGMDFIDTNVFPMAPGQNRTVLPVNLVLNTPGDYPIVVCADRSIAPSSNLNLKPLAAPGVIAEGNENDNCLEGPTIRAVDHLLADISIAENEAGCNVSSVAVDQEFSCFAKVRNVGHVDSPAISDSVVIYVDGKATFEDLGALSKGGGMQQFRWDNLVIEDDGGAFPRDISIEICADPVSLEHLGGQVEEYDDGEMERNNCKDFTIAVVTEDTVRADMTLSSDSIRFGESVDITISAVDNQGVTKLGVNLAFDFDSPWSVYNCPEGAVSCEKTWAYTPDWSGETKVVEGYARGVSLTGEPEVVLPKKSLTVLPAQGGGGNMAFKVVSETTNNPIKMANVRVYGMGNVGLVGECSADSTGICGVDIQDWGEQYTLIVQGYGYDTVVVEPYIPEDFGGSVALASTQEEKVRVRFSVMAADSEAKIKEAMVKVLALATGDAVASYASPEILAEFVEITDESGEYGLELYRAPERDKSYTAIISHPDYLNAFFDFDVAMGSAGEAYPILLEGSAGTAEVTFKVVDEDTGSGIGGAVVQVIDVGTRLTDSAGECTFDLIPGVGYDIRATAAGYKDYALDNYLDNFDASYSGGLTLSLTPLTEAGPVLVTGSVGVGGGSVVNEISDEITASISVPGGALPLGVNEVDITINPLLPTAVGAATAVANLPSGMAIIGSYIYDFSVTGDIAFNPKATISLTYTDASVAGFDESDLAISYYNEGTEEWEQPPVNINAGTNAATIAVSNFGLFVITTNRCYDSDPVQDINSLGVVSYGADEWPDECTDDNTTRQYKCNGFDFDSASNFMDSDCLGLGCTTGVCRDADDRVGVIFQVVQEGAVAPIVAAEVSVRNTATNIDEGSCKTKDDGRCTIYLAIGVEYQLKVQHGDYNDINYGGTLNITALEPVQPIEMTGIPKRTVVYTLNRGLNFLFVSTAQPLDWSEVISACPDAYKGFWVYSSSREKWGLSSQIHSGRAGYVLRLSRDAGPCTVRKTGHDTGFSLLINLKQGTNLFQVPVQARINDIIGDCEVERDDAGVPMLEKYRATEDEEAVRVGLDEILLPGTGYWVKVKADCSLSKE